MSDIFIMNLGNLNKKQVVIDYILGINQTEPSDEIQKGADTFYYSMRLLLPKKLFIGIVNCMGGLDSVLNSNEHQYAIAETFKVKLDLVKLRICQLYIEQSKKTKMEDQYNKLASVIEELYSLGIDDDILPLVNQNYVRFQENSSLKLIRTRNGKT